MYIQHFTTHFKKHDIQHSYNQLCFEVEIIYMLATCACVALSLSVLVDNLQSIITGTER